MDDVISGALDPSILATLATSGGSPMDLSSVLAAMSPSGDAMNFLNIVGSSGVLSGTGVDPSGLLSILNAGGTFDLSSFTNMLNPNYQPLQPQTSQIDPSAFQQSQGSGSSGSDFTSGMGQDLAQDLVKKLVKSAAKYALEKLKNRINNQGQHGATSVMQYAPAAHPNMSSHPMPPFQYAQGPVVPHVTGFDMSSVPSYTQPGQMFGQQPAQPQYPLALSTSHSYAPHSSQYGGSAQSPPFHAHSSSFSGENSASAWPAHVPNITMPTSYPSTPVAHPISEHSAHNSSTSHSLPSNSSTWRPHLPPRPSPSHSMHHTSSQSHLSSVHNAQTTHTAPTTPVCPPVHPASNSARPHTYHSHSMSTSSVASGISGMHPHTSSAHSTSPSSPLLSNMSSPRPPAHHAHTISVTCVGSQLAGYSSSSVPPPPPPRPVSHHAHTMPTPLASSHSTSASIYGSHIAGKMPAAHSIRPSVSERPHATPPPPLPPSPPSPPQLPSYEFCTSMEPMRPPMEKPSFAPGTRNSRASLGSVGSPQTSSSVQAPQSRGQSLYASAMAEFANTQR